MREFNANPYLGIPYREGGRDRDGLDCWGLARLIYAEQFDITLPGHDDATIATMDGAALADYEAAHMESWQRVAAPVAGDLIRLRSRGEGYHVGVVIDAEWFIHARSGRHSVAERYGSRYWTPRVEGYYRYVPRAEPQAASVSLVGRPHPLRLARIETHVHAGRSLAEVIAEQCEGIRAELVRCGIAFINGIRVPYADWSATTLVDGDTVEFRMLPGDDERSALMMIVAIAAAWAGNAAAGAWAEGGSASLAATYGVSPAAMGAMASMGTMLVGSMVVNRIAPLPNSNIDDNAPKPQWMLAGGPNQEGQYASFPVILGAHRFTPPLGAKSYLTTNGSDRFLHLLLIWGYGPLDITDLRIGDTPLSSFEDIDVRHLRGEPQEYANGALDRSRPEVAAFLDCYGRATGQQQPQVKLDTTPTSRTTERINIRRVDVVLSFPGGIVKYIEGSATPLVVDLIIEYRRLGYWAAGQWVDSVSGWSDGYSTVPGMSRYLIQSGGNGPALKTIIGLRGGRELFVKTASPRWVGDTLTYDVWPELAWNEVPIYLFSGHMLTETRNTNMFTGLVPTVTTEDVQVITDNSGIFPQYGTRRDWYVSIGAGSVPDTLRIQGADNNPFDRVVSLDFSQAPGQYEIRVKRAQPEDTGITASHSAYWLALTEFGENENPVRPPVPMAMTAVCIKATNQINGTLEGVSATVRSCQHVWDGSTWRLPADGERRSNPASLLRHVLQHPGYVKRCATSRIDLAAFQHFSEWCDSKGYIYENVMTSQRPVRDVLREIAAAGRASITQADGRWSVVIDEPKTQIAQHFTPHNSWGFKGTLLLPEIPHALKIQFLNRRQSYQPDEFMVYADGYSAANATMIESIQLPGVTDAGTAEAPGPIFKLGRFHLEQAILRREEYELYADHESIVCTRGDRVEVAHDVPLWGLGSGRIKSVTLDGSSRATAVVLDERVSMEAGKTYALRWRTATNADAWATVNTEAGTVSSLVFSSPVAASVPGGGDLFMFGESGRVTQSLLVKSIEQMPNMQARILLDDYAPAVFDSEMKPFGTWQSGITLPPPLMRTAINQKPIVESVVANEFALTRSSGGYQANIIIRWRTDAALPTNAAPVVEPIDDQVVGVELQCRRSDSQGLPWKPWETASASSGSASIGPMTEGVSYDLRLRFVSDSGRSGSWVLVPAVLVTGKTNPPATVTGLRSSFADTSLTTATVTLDWDDSPEIDVVDYLVSRPGRSVYVQASTFTELAEWVGARSYTVQARDVMGNLSPVATLVVAKSPPAAPQNFRASVVDNNVLFYWDTPDPTTLPIDSFELRRGAVAESAEVIGRKAGGFTTVFETAGGNKTYWLYTIDTDAQYSTPVSLSVTVDAPPDYALKLDHDSTLNGTLSNAVAELDGIVLPVDVTETVSQHYTTRSWSTRQDQINAGYPIYAQPPSGSGYYEETIDYGAVLSSSRVSVTPTVDAIVGAPATTITISSRLNVGDSWTDHSGSQVYLTNFRYIKVRITVASGGTALARLRALNVRLDSKLKTITGMVTANAADSGGTTVYLTEDRSSGGTLVFVDVDSIQLTPQGTTALTAVFDFADVPNPPSMRVLLFNAAGSRVSGSVAYSVRGY